VVVLPTPTPLTYTVVAGDTLIGIANRFGIRLNDLLAANPGVSANMLGIGTVLKIPSSGNFVSEPTPTPVPQTLLQARCWPTADDGGWCFALLRNDTQQTIENLAVQFSLLDGAGQEVRSQAAYGLLDILPAGRMMPLAAFFPAPFPAGAETRAQLLTAFSLPADDARYISIALQNMLVTVDWNGKSAQVSGQAMPVMLDGQVKTLWILGVAYDAAGNVVGMRRWESAEPVSGGVQMPFSFSVYSVGPVIDRVELLTEARP